MDALLARLYALLLRLYPAAYRAAFGEEMQGVFAEALDARESTRFSLVLRELASLPAGLMAAWGWSLRHKEQFAPRLSLAAEGAPAGAYFPPHPAPTPWLEALLAAVPFLLLGLASGLPGLLNMPETAALFRVTLLYPLVLAGAAALVWSVLRGWPRWAAGWYLIWLVLLLYPISALLPADRNGSNQNLVMIFFPLLTAWVLYRVARRDRIAAVLAGLPAMLLVWVPFMEQTPMTIIPAALRGGAFLSLFLLPGLGAVLFLRANRLELALGLAFLASAISGGLAAYAGIYFGGMLSFSEPGPSPRAALEAFLPAFILSASIAIGPQLAGCLRDLGLRAGKWGRVSYRLALLGLLLMLILAVGSTIRQTGGEYYAWVNSSNPLARLAYWLFISDRLILLRWGAALVVYTAGFGWLAICAEQAGVLPKLDRLALLFLLPLCVPAGLLASVNVYMGWLLPYRWALNAGLLAGVAASAWLVLIVKGPASPPTARG